MSARVGLVLGLVLVAAAVLIGGGASVAQTSDAFEVYGRLNVTVQNSDEALEEEVEVQSNASRIGVRGEQALDGGLKVIYQLEFGVDVDGQGDDVFTPRNQFVGLEGSFGTIKVGRHDTALKQAQGDFDLFDDLEGDIGKVFNGENRLTNYIGYTTPVFGPGVSATLNFFPGEDEAPGDAGRPDRSSASLAYETDVVYAAVAYDQDVDGEGIDTTRLVGGYTVGPARIGLLYQRLSDGAISEDGIGVSIAGTFGKNVLKLEYLTADIWRVNPAADPLDNMLDELISVGVDHHLGKSTKVFAFYTTGEIGGADERNSYTAIGIEHNF